MAQASQRTALIVGAGSGLSASLARLLAKSGYRVTLAARSVDKLAKLTADIGAEAVATDAADREAVAKLFARVGTPDVVVYNASYRTRGPFIDLDPAEVAKTMSISAYGGFLVGQEAARRMLPRGSGTIIFTGASASVKGYAQSAPFAMGKFALRGLAQSMARELACRPSCGACRHRRRHPQRHAPGGGRQAGLNAGPRRDRAELPASHRPEAQRLDLGD